MNGGFWNKLVGGAIIIVGTKFSSDEKSYVSCCHDGKYKRNKEKTIYGMT